MGIKDVIQRHGWTLDRLGAQMTNKNGEKGISHSSVSQIINGNPTLSKLQEIAGIIGISVAELVDETSSTNTITCPKCGARFKLEDD